MYPRAAQKGDCFCTRRAFRQEDAIAATSQALPRARPASMCAASFRGGGLEMGLLVELVDPTPQRARKSDKPSGCSKSTAPFSSLKTSSISRPPPQTSPPVRFSPVFRLVPPTKSLTLRADTLLGLFRLAGRKELSGAVRPTVKTISGEGVRVRGTPRERHPRWQGNRRRARKSSRREGRSNQEVFAVGARCRCSRKWSTSIC